jgi:hypothetical protein
MGIRLTREQLRRVICEEASRLVEVRRSAKTRAGAEEKLLRSQLTDLETRRARARGNTPADKGNRATLDDDITAIKRKLKTLGEGRGLAEGLQLSLDTTRTRARSSRASSMRSSSARRPCEVVRVTRTTSRTATASTTTGRATATASWASPGTRSWSSR